MTKIKKIINQKKQMIGFEIEGHSGYATIGSDIVCAGISSIAQGTIIGLQQVLHIELEVIIQDGFLRVVIIEDPPAFMVKLVDILFRTMFLTAKEIEKEYKNFVKVCTSPEIVV